jgi:L-ascorbate metabolism protein UlaG (beta-lactamase superfamily)
MLKRQLYSLSTSTVVEPLVNRWSAWSHLISPVPSSLHLLHYQIKLLRSYLKDPKVHVNACRDVKLRSGTLVDIPAERASEVEDFLSNTENQASENIRLAKATTEFHNKLVREAKGQSLDPFYGRLPEVLRGYTELLYDYYNRPTVRFLESLLYESKYYRRDMQSLRLFKCTSDSARPFFMNTPRLHQNGDIDWSIPFESPEVDELFKLDSSPRELGYIRDLLGLSAADEPQLLQLLANKAVAQHERWDSSDVRIRYFGHACLLIEWKGKAILTDPCIPVMPSEGGIERFTYDDLPETIDYAIVTHNHHDHFCIETLLRLRHKLECLVVPRSFGVFYGDLSLKLMAKKIGFKHVVELDTLESIQLPDGEIIAIPFMGEHADLPHGKTAYAIRAGNRQMLIAADSDCLDREVYDNVRRVIGGINALFLGMECVGAPLSWSCGPFLPFKPDFSHEQSRRYKGCDSTRAMSIIEAIGAKEIYLYAMGLEPWLEYLLGLALTEEAEQMKQAGWLLSSANQKGLIHGQLLFGKHEIHIQQ